MCLSVFFYYLSMGYRCNYIELPNIEDHRLSYSEQEGKKRSENVFPL